MDTEKTMNAAWDKLITTKKIGEYLFKEQKITTDIVRIVYQHGYLDGQMDAMMEMLDEGD